MNVWKKDDLFGIWQITWKLDGVRAIILPSGVVMSRGGKPLYNLDHLPPGDYEIYKDNWETSISLVRTKNGGKKVMEQYAYRLEPTVDPRILAATVKDPTKQVIDHYLNEALKIGHEGLVLRNDQGPIPVRLKVKPKDSYDVPIWGVEPGRGKHKGKMGALITPKGKVGTGFTDEQREFAWWKHIGEIIEVESQGLTPSGKFKFPRFKRLRFDK